MKKSIWILGVVLLLLSGITSFANEGESGFFGGVSVGTNLPSTLETHVTTKTANQQSYKYKEIVFLSGEPVVFEGTLTITRNKSSIATKLTGSYTERFVVDATNIEKNATLKRNLQLTTTFRKVEQDFVDNLTTRSTVSKWDETIVIDGVTYTLNEYDYFNKTLMEDRTPGINYYVMPINYRLSYRTSDNQTIRVDVDNIIEGYYQPWSKIENQHMNMIIDASGEKGSWQMEVNLNPNVEAKKTLYYEESRPMAVSFDGIYNERLERNVSLSYEIITPHPNLTEQQKKNSIGIDTGNTIEALISPRGLDFLKGHWSEQDIRQLYSMEVLTNTPHENIKYQAMTRGEYVKALSLAMKLDISTYTNTRIKKVQIFDDVPTNHPLYPYIMAAYDAKLTKGQGNTFGVDSPITREEAIVIFIRIIGLERLGDANNPTPFVDDAQISSWAKKEIMAAYNLGIVQGNSEGKVEPKRQISVVEAGSIINRLINYLRYELVEQYKNL